MGSIDALVQDLRFSGRLARRSPFLTCAVVATLSLGVGLDAGVFTIVDGAVRQPRVQHDPDSFVHVQVDFSTRTTRSVGQPFSTTSADYLSYRDGVTSLSSLAAWHVVRATVDRDAKPTLAMLVSCNFFTVYGLQRPLIGRVLTPADCLGTDQGVAISEEVWRGRFEADPEIVGKSVDINRQPVPVVGVIPSNFAGQLRGPGYWMPLHMQPLFIKGLDLSRDSSTPWLALEGRLRPGFSRAGAQRELTMLAVQQDRQHGDRETIVSLTNGSVLEDPLLGHVAALVILLTMSALTLIVVIACANVTVLLLSRAAARQREMAIRVSLGASRSRLVAMLLTEGLVLSLMAFPLSAYLVYQVPRVAKVMVPMLPYYNMRPNLMVFAYMVLLTGIVGGVVGLAPATESLRLNVWNRTQGHASLRVFGARWRTRDVLIACQVGISLVLLIGAGLFVRAQSAIRDHDPGFDAEHTVVLPLRVQASIIPDLFERVRAIPGIRAVASAQASPLDIELMPTTVVGRADQSDVGERRKATVGAVSAEYFVTLKLPILRGRSFSRSSSSTSVVISHTLARALWPATESVGEALRDEAGKTFTVIGVVRDVEMLSGQTAMVYTLRAEHEPGGVLLANVVGPSSPVEQRLRQLLAQLEPAGVVDPRTLAATFDEMASKFSVLVMFVSFLGVVGIVLAVIGLYGVVAYAVSSRTKELGIRMALGATKPAIMRLLLRSGITPVIVGLAAGFLVASGAASVLTHVLAGTPVPIAPRDPTTFGLATALLVATVVVAMSVPAWRATTQRPVDALRHE
jgi:predicted permease